MSLLDKISLLVTPNAVKGSKLYSVIPSNGTGDLIVVRNTTATRINSLGSIESVAVDVPRLNYDAIGGQPYLLLEPQRTNRLLNSNVVVNQSISTTAVAQTLSFTGTGTITLSGTFTGSLVGTGTNNRVNLTFTPTSGTLTITVTGSCLLGQLANGTFATSYVPTLSSAVTRNLDLITLNNVYTNNLVTDSGGTLFIELINNFQFTRDGFTRGISLTDVSGSNGFIMVPPGSNSRTGIRKIIAGVTTFLFTTSTDIVKIAIKWNGVTADIFENGVKVVAATSFPFTALELLSLNGGDVPKSIRSLSLSTTPLSDAECVNLTTL